MAKKDTITQLEKLISELEAHGYSSRHYSHEFEVNVKLYRLNSCDTEDLVKRLPQYKTQIERKFTENSINDAYYQFIDDQQRYAKEWFDGCMCDKGDKLSQALDLVDIESVGFYGRSGGHLCFNLKDNLRDRCDQLAEDLTGGACDSKQARLELKEIEHDYELIQYLMDEVKSMIPKGDDFIEWLIDHIQSNYVDQWDEEIQRIKDINTAVELAHKHGYVLAQIIKSI